jgi:hypothetical protein
VKIRRTRIVMATIILLAAPVALLMAMGCIPPAMTYQGALTDPSGDPVPDGVYDMEFRLWDLETDAYVFTQTESLTVTNGIFDVVLGSNYLGNPLPVDKFSDGFELEITVEGDTLEPRQMLYGSPYAFTLYPGAVIIDDYNAANPALTIDKDSTGPALRLEGGELETDQRSYWWISGSQIVVGAFLMDDEIVVYHSDHGAMICVTAGNTGDYDELFIPLDIPGTLYGQTVSVEEVRVYYRVDSAGDYIDTTRLYKTTGATTSDLLRADHMDRNSTTATYYDLTPPSPVALGSASGPLVVKFDMHWSGAGAARKIYIGMVRVTLLHE